MKNYYKIIFVFFSFISFVSAQNLAHFSGTYKFGEDIEKESVGVVHIVPDTGNSYFFHLNVSKAAPSYSSSFLFSKENYHFPLLLSTPFLQIGRRHTFQYVGKAPKQLTEGRAHVYKTSE